MPIGSSVRDYEQEAKVKFPSQPVPVKADGMDETYFRMLETQWSEYEQRLEDRRIAWSATEKHNDDAERARIAKEASLARERLDRDRRERSEREKAAASKAAASKAAASKAAASKAGQDSRVRQQSRDDAEVEAGKEELPHKKAPVVAVPTIISVGQPGACSLCLHRRGDCCFDVVNGRRRSCAYCLGSHKACEYPGKHPKSPKSRSKGKGKAPANAEASSSKSAMATPMSAGTDGFVPALAELIAGPSREVSSRTADALDRIADTQVAMAKAMALQAFASVESARVVRGYRPRKNWYHGVMAALWENADGMWSEERQDEVDEEDEERGEEQEERGEEEEEGEKSGEDDDEGDEESDPGVSQTVRGKSS